MMRLSAWVSALLVAFETGCAAREACDHASKSRESAPLTGSRLLSNAGEREFVPLDVALEGLPELWPPEGAVEGERLSVELALGYEGAPADGTVEMPRVRVFLDDELLGTSPSYPGPSGVAFSAYELGACESSAQGCCPFGSRTCRITPTLSIERVDGAPFPAINVIWDVRAFASINDCPLGGSNPRLELSSVAP